MTLKSLINGEWLKSMVGLARKTPAGCFVEVGVYQGGSAEQLYQITERDGRQLHLFDTFTGIPVKSDIDRHVIGDFSDVDLESLKAAMPNAIFHVGIFPDTLTDAVSHIAFLHCDVDQYESQKAVNKYLWPRVVRGGIMQLDDYYLLQGIRQAIDEDFPGQLQTPNGIRPYLVKE